jgi:hypothetical protein
VLFRSKRLWGCRECNLQMTSEEILASSDRSKKLWSNPEYRSKFVKNTGSRLLALSCVEELDPMLKDIVHVKCSICNNVFQKDFRYVVKCCRSSGKRYRCHVCACREIQSRPEVRAKAITTGRINNSYSNASRRLWQDPNYRDKVIETNRIIANSESGRQQRSKQSKQAWENEEYRSKITNMSKNNHVTPDFTPEIREKLRQASLKNWQNPTRAGMSWVVSATGTPASIMAATLAWGVPLVPLMMAPAWPMRLPGGAVRPPMKPMTGLVMCALM